MEEITSVQTRETPPQESEDLRIVRFDLHLGFRMSIHPADPALTASGQSVYHIHEDQPILAQLRQSFFQIFHVLSQ